MDNNQLSHHGIVGMKWGIRRFQNKDGSLTNAGRKRYGDSDDDPAAKRQQRKEDRIAKRQAKREERAAKEEAKKLADIEEQKSKVLKSRSAKQLYDNADLFTTQELQSAYNRLVLERNIESLTPKQVNQGEKFVDNGTKWLNKTSSLLEAGTKLYKSVDTVRKLFGDDTSSKITDYRVKDISKLSDDALAKAVQRATKENRLKTFLNS